MGAVSAPRIVIMMGVAGSGKTTIGARLAQELGWDFADADGFHPPANVEKMSAGQPLTDADRAPWLTAIRAYITDRLTRGAPAVVTCSALKQTYREVIVPDPARVQLVYLRGTREQLWARLCGRENHFMKPAMLDSQLAALEEPTHALTVDITPAPAAIVAQIRQTLFL